MMFNLAYGLHWSYPDMMEMPYEDLEMMHVLLIQQWEKEQAALNNPSGKG